MSISLSPQSAETHLLSSSPCGHLSVQVEQSGAGEFGGLDRIDSAAHGVADIHA